MLTTTSTKVNKKDSFHFILQNKLIDRIDVLDEIGCIELLPNTNLSTTKQVADFYGVNADAVRMLILNFRELLRKDGFKTCGANEIIEIMNNESPENKIKLSKGKGGYYLDGEFLIPYCKSGVFTKQAVLRVGMMLTESEVAERVRGKLLETNETVITPINQVVLNEVAEKSAYSNSPTTSDKQEATIHDGQVVIDSREVAEMIGKRHGNLLRDIKRYVDVISENSNLSSQDFFIPSTYRIAGNNKTYECYLLTKKGCSMVANKMTGDNGILFTATYVTRFEEMEEQLKNQTQPQAQATPSYMIENPIERAEQWILEEKERMRLKELVEQQAKELEKKKVLSITTHKEHQKKCDILRNIVRTGCNDETDAMKRWNFLYKHFESMYNIEARLLRKAYIAETGYDITIMGYIDKMLNMLDELLDTAKKVFPYETDEVLGNQFEIDFFIN